MPVACSAKQRPSPLIPLPIPVNGFERKGMGRGQGEGNGCRSVSGQLVSDAWPWLLLVWIGHRALNFPEFNFSRVPVHVIAAQGNAAAFPRLVEVVHLADEQEMISN